MKELKYLIKDLYTIDFHISDNILRHILQHESEAVPYLLAILEDAMENFEKYNEEAYYVEHYKGKQFEWFTAYHALLLLSEMEADEAFPTVLEFYLQGRYFLDFWLREIWPSYGTYALAKIGKKHVKELMAVLEDPEQDMLTRRMVSGAFSRMVVLYPQTRVRILEGYRKILKSNNARELITNTVIDILDCHGYELEPDIQAAYDQKKVEEDFFPKDEVVFTAKDAVDPGWDIFIIYKKLRQEFQNESPHSRS